MEPTICRAIEAHHRLWLRYGGLRRVVEPHIYGEDGQGHELLNAYQVSGGSQSGEPMGWKCFDMRKVEALEVLPVHFEDSEQAYNPDDRIFNKVYSCI